MLHQPNPDRPPGSPTPLYQSMRQVERAVSQLDVLTHRVGMEIATRLPQFRSQEHRQAISRLRNHINLFSQSLVDIIAAAKSDKLLPGILPLRRLLDNRTLKVLNHFQTSLRTICATGRLGEPERVEMIRFIMDELGETLRAMAGAVQSVDLRGQDCPHDLAITDDLTGMPNRRAFSRLAQELSDRLAPPTQICVMHIDIDRLKTINDLNGHAAGDAAIRHAATSIQASIVGNEFCARIGGDEFLIIMFGDHASAALAARSAQLIARISTPFRVKDTTLEIGASVGIASGAVSAADPLDNLIQNSDLALYAAKNEGRGIYVFYDEKMRTRQQQIEAVGQEILSGLQRREFVPYFQPQVEGRSGKLVGVEALMRWNHPTRGLLAPFHFLETAETAGLLPQLDNVILREALAAVRRWRDQGLAIPQLSLNLTSSRLNSPHIVSELLAACRAEDVSPAMIGLEILESAMIEDKSRVMIDNAAALSEAGFRLELDDFGTGHASVSNLRYFKVNRIKIDKSFIKDIHQYSDLSMITASVIGLAHSLRIDALGEGVEKPEERLILNALGCDHIQGFGVAHPMPEDALAKWVEKTQSPGKKLNFIQKTA